MASVATTSRSRPSADPALDELLGPVLEAFERHRAGEDDAPIVEAARASELAHRGQVRRSGEDYVTHPVAVALTVAELGLDAATVAAALLHDAVEDTGMSLANVRAQFGEVVARVVDGVTKLDRLEFDSKEAQQAATIRKMFLAMATDWRVLLIKLADRLHNMRTIAVMPEVNQRATAQETLDVYAPLAHRLGVQQVKWQLEDLAFATLQPKRYAEIDQMVASRTPEREQYVAEVCGLLRDKLSAEHIAADLSGRPKHLWSIYEKMVVNGKEFSEIFDLVGLRAITENEHDCWATLGALHALWHPVQGRFKDYINQPKFNLYQSLHTTVIGLNGKPIEVQIRTQEMHRRAEFGIAAHWGYKEHATPSEMAWMRRLTDTEAESADAIDFLEALKLDLEQDEVYVFTPKGRVIALVANSTPVDFAYAVHTEVGHHCVGAKVNGRLVPLDTRLSSADVVEVLTSKAETAGPSRDWVGFVQSTRARAKIRQWFSRERREDSIESGRDELVRALRRAGLPIQTSISSGALQVVGAQMNLLDLDGLLAAIGESQISAQSVVQRLQRELRGGDEESLPTTVARGPRVGTGPRRSAGVYVEGLDDVMVHLAKCCSPVPGDQILGFVTQGRGVSVHRTDCSNATALASESRHRLVDVEWDASSNNSFRVSLDVRAFDRAGLLADVSSAMAESHLNILAAHTTTSPDRVVKMSFEIELADPSHLSSVLTQLQHVDGVFDAYRQLPGRGR
jgi:GTP diphosphokinase / guanosine-3',5'-bis(diphosphate) 3'-diphosphatase